VAVERYIELEPTKKFDFIHTKMSTLPQPVGHDIQAKLKELESIPLFMRNLSDDPSNQGDALEALQALIHDGTPDGGYTVQNQYHQSDV
jgi:hypothetical protein